MRKLVLIAIALVLAALVWMFAQTLEPSSTRGPTIAPQVGSQAGTSLDPLVDSASNADPASRSALDSPAVSESAPNVASTSGCALRVTVRFARSEDYEPEELDVRVLGLFGEEHAGNLERGNAFLFSNLSLDTYTIEVSEAASMKAVQRVKLDTLGETKVVEITLTPSRSLKVHWMTSDGRPIAKAALDPDLEPGPPTFEVVASRVALRQENSGNSALIVVALRTSIRRGDPFGEDGGPWLHSEEPGGTGEASLDLAKDSADPTLFCTFGIRTTGTLWLSAWYRGKLLDSQPIAQDRTEVCFTTSLAQLRSVLVPVSLRVVDDVTGAPVTAARVQASGQGMQRHRVDSQGRCTLNVEPGRKNIDVQSDIRGGMARSLDGITLFGDFEAPETTNDPVRSALTWVRIRVIAQPGVPLDLGEIRLPHKRVLRFRVLDKDMRPADGAKVDLIRKSSYDDVTGECDVQHASSDSQGLAVFEAAASETYVVAGRFIHLGNLDSEPLIVDAGTVGDEPDTIAGDITLRPAHRVSIAFDPPPRPGAKVLIETTTGLPVSMQVLDELGLCVLGLGGVHYRLRLVEDGQLQLTLPFSVTSDPFALTVRR